VVPFRVLPRTKPADSQVKSRRFTLLQTLGRCASRQLLWNQANPHSFGKTPGVGCTTTKPSFRISNLQTLSRVSSNQSVTKIVRNPQADLRFSCSHFCISTLVVRLRLSSLVHRFTTALVSDCYKSFFRKLFVFTSIQNPGGVLRPPPNHLCKACSRE
jgi:hypothetical protein